jgi:hypothetical protein
MSRTRQRSTESHVQETAADQPRPALGRRPWFALLRRARSLRRFALAIRPESVAGTRLLLTLADDDGVWAVSPVLLASTRRERWLGVKTGFDRVLLATDSVHGRGLSAPLQLVGIDGSGIVLSVRMLKPGGFVRLIGVSWTLELPVGDDVPAVGAVLSIYPRDGEWKTDPVRNPYWQSR